MARKRTEFLPSIPAPPLDPPEGRPRGAVGRTDMDLAIEEEEGRPRGAVGRAQMDLAIEEAQAAEARFQAANRAHYDADTPDHGPDGASTELRELAALEEAADVAWALAEELDPAFYRPDGPAIRAVFLDPGEPGAQVKEGAPPLSIELEAQADIDARNEAHEAWRAQEAQAEAKRSGRLDLLPLAGPLEQASADAVRKALGLDDAEPIPLALATAWEAGHTAGWNAKADDAGHQLNAMDAEVQRARDAWSGASHRAASAERQVTELVAMVLALKPIPGGAGPATTTEAEPDPERLALGPVGCALLRAGGILLAVGAMATAAGLEARTAFYMGAAAAAVNAAFELAGLALTGRLGE